MFVQLNPHEIPMKLSMVSPEHKALRILTRCVSAPCRSKRGHCECLVSQNPWKYMEKYGMYQVKPIIIECNGICNQ